MPVGLQSHLNSPKLMDLRRPVAAGWLTATPGWENSNCAHHTHRYPQLPPYLHWDRDHSLRGQRRGRKGIENLFIFSDNEMANFQQSYHEKSFVNCFNKSKTWYNTEDSRFLLGFPTFFSCHLSQDKISPLEAASSLNFKARACYHNTNMLMCLCYPSPR